MTEQSRSEWLAARRKGIGGSDAAAVLGLSPWKTPLQVYLEKRDESGETPDNESMLWGRVLEPVIRQQYAERTGRTVRVPDGIITHGQYDWMLANLDGVTDDRRVVEIKTARSGQDWGEPGTDEIPGHYLLQVQHYMAVTGFLVADVAVLIGGSDFRLYEVEADGELQEMLIDGEREFWQRVIEGNPPEPVSMADAQALFGRCGSNQAIEASEEVVSAIIHLHDIRQLIEAAKHDEEVVKAIILNAMGHADTLTASGKTLATWKQTKPASRFDTVAFKASHPELHAQFVKVGEPSRRFMLK